MESNKTKNKKATRILYIALAAVICVGAIVAAVVIANNNVTPDTGDGTVDDLPAGGNTDSDNTLPAFMAPAVGLVTKGHDMETLVYSNTTDDWRVHRGIDIVTAIGAEVMAAADGTITAIEEDPMYGTTVTITHKGGAVTRYCNLDASLPENVKVGATVKCGDCIGVVGESATIEIADDPHLHFEMTVDGKDVDPMEYISEKSQESSLSQDVSYEG